MNAFSKIDMGEVTRLTQAGKLAEAMALLQGHTASGIARGSPGSDVPRLDPGDQAPVANASTWSLRRFRVAPGRLPLNSGSGLPASPYGPSRPRGCPTSRRRCWRFATGYPSWARFPV